MKGSSILVAWEEGKDENGDIDAYGIDFQIPAANTIQESRHPRPAQLSVQSRNGPLSSAQTSSLSSSQPHGMIQSLSTLEYIGKVNLPTLPLTSFCQF